MLMHHTTMAYNLSVILFGLLALLAVINPLVSSADCKSAPLRVNPTTCCQIPSLITEEFEEKCKKMILSLPFPPPSHPSAIAKPNDKSNAAHPHQHGMQTCFISCFLNETGIISTTDDKLNEEKLSAHLNKALINATDSIPVVERSFKTCIMKAEELRSKFKDSMKVKLESSAAAKKEEEMFQGRQPRCNHLYGFVMSCVFKETLINCPSNKWSNTTECNDLQYRMKNCMRTKSDDKSNGTNSIEEF